MATNKDIEEDIFDEEKDNNFADKEWNRLKESLTKVFKFSYLWLIHTGLRFLTLLKFWQKFSAKVCLNLGATANFRKPVWMSQYNSYRFMLYTNYYA